MPKPRRKPAAASQPAVKCPKCGLAQPVEPVTVIQPQDAAFAALMRGTLNVHACGGCGVKFHLETTLIFRDAARRAIVVLIPADSAEERLTAEKNLDAVLQRALSLPDGREDAELRHLLVCRLTFTRRDMIEKIALLLNGLDDRLVEFVKFQLFRNKKHDLDPVRQQLLYDFSSPEKQHIAFVVFDRESGKASAALHVPMDAYRELASALVTSDDLKQEIAELFPGHIVTVDLLL